MLAASAVNLALGAFWVLALVAVLLLRRRVRFAAGLVLLGVVGAGVLGVRGGWYVPPAPASYGLDEADWIRARLPLRRVATEVASRGDSAATVTRRARLGARCREELRYASPDFQERAGAAVALTRGLGRLREQARDEVAVLEDAVRRFALTLTSAEFRDLDGRRARLRAWLTEAEARLATARDEDEVADVARTLDPVAMAPVSLRALYEDLLRVDRATLALVRRLTGGAITVAATSTIALDEARGAAVVENRYALTVEPPLRIVRVDVRALRAVASERAMVRTLAYEVAGAAQQEISGSDEVAVSGSAARVVIVDRRIEAAARRSLRSVLKSIRFHQILVDGATDPAGELLVTGTFARTGGPEVVLPVAVPLPSLERITAPRYALYAVSLPGVIATAEAHDSWTPASLEGGAARSTTVAIEVVPATVLLRNAVFARVAAYLYRPNPATAVVLVGLAALTSALARRRRPAPPSAAR